MGQTLRKEEEDPDVLQHFADDCLECVFVHLPKKDLLNVMLVRI